AAPAKPPQTIELRNGQYWEPVENPTTAPVTDEVLDRSEQLVANGNNAAAKKTLVAWLKRERFSPLRDRALYLLGLANYQYGDRINSYYNFDELMDKYPDSKYFYPALDKQYQIADAFLNGYKRRFLMIPMLSAEDEAIEMLFRVQERSPGSPLAEKALKRTADYYYADAQYDLAVDAYQAFIERYKRSPEIPQARIKKAFAELAQFHGTKFDPTPVINARTSLEELAIDYPDLARQENVAAVIDRIDAALARKVYQNAQFYLRTHEPRAAAYNLKYLIQNYPNSQEAQQAKADLARLPENVRSGPEPTSKPIELRTEVK
ncbi:MAG TPA: outer membrane protein assembly factor BamD, partial [Tepidisphaeraceae bacterium]